MTPRKHPLPGGAFALEDCRQLAQLAVDYRRNRVGKIITNFVKNNRVGTFFIQGNEGGGGRRSAQESQHGLNQFESDEDDEREQQSQR